MFSYKLSYINLSYQDRKIITLDRIDKENNRAERIRAAQKDDHRSEATNFLDYIITDCNTMQNSTYNDECFYSEGILNSSKVDERTIGLHSKIFSLINQTYPGWPEIVRTTFVGDIADTHGGVSDMCSNLTITNLKFEQKQLIDQIFDETKKIFQDIKAKPDTLKCYKELFLKSINQPNEQVAVEDDSLCCICMDAKSNAYWSPCSHNSFCFDCTKTLTTCPECRTKGCAELKAKLASF
jgi:hypothetical protein